MVDTMKAALEKRIDSLDWMALGDQRPRPIARSRC